MNNSNLLEQYSKGLASTGKTRILFLRFAKDFLDYADGDFSREKISKYVDHLRQQHHYSDGSVNFAFRVARTVFSRSAMTLREEGFEWPYRRGESPQIREDKVQENAPALDPKTVQRMILAAKEKGKTDERAFLALSSTYGLRKIEMLELRQTDIRIKDKTIHIATAKHGRERTHIIPDAILPYLEAYDFNTTRSDFYLFSLWYRLEYLIRLKHIHRVNWHSVRRSLITMLGRKLPDLSIKSFVRHKQRTSSDMTFRYSAVKFVGEEEDRVEVVGESFQNDQDVFAVHPFLKFWE